ncbi:hypothetical protein M3Y97_00325300 [Aphelenchoides bicaudatus]|nr:hypothetical protein M3Y97_00325300 [Aphelenchoides bicaudatus]
MDVSILDVETTVKPKQSQHIRWQINDFNNFYNSQAGQLTQHFGPLPIDNLKFSLQIRKRTDCQFNFQANLSKEFGDCDLGLLKIELKNGAGKKFEEHFLNLNQPDQPNSIFCVDMLYENVQVQTQIRQTDSHLDTEETSHIVTSKSSTADSFEMVSQNGSESDYRPEIKALHLQETQPTKVTGEWAEQESGTVSDEELEGNANIEATTER